MIECNSADNFLPTIRVRRIYLWYHWPSKTTSNNPMNRPRGLKSFSLSHYRTNFLCVDMDKTPEPKHLSAESLQLADVLGHSEPYWIPFISPLSNLKSNYSHIAQEREREREKWLKIQLYVSQSRHWVNCIHWQGGPPNNVGTVLGFKVDSDFELLYACCILTCSIRLSASAFLK